MVGGLLRVPFPRSSGFEEPRRAGHRVFEKPNELLTLLTKWLQNLRGLWCSFKFAASQCKSSHAPDCIRNGDGQKAGGILAASTWWTPFGVVVPSWAVPEASNRSWPRTVRLYQSELARSAANFEAPKKAALFFGLSTFVWFRRWLVFDTSVCFPAACRLG